MERALEELREYIEDYLRQRGLSLRKPFRCLNPAHEDRHPSMSYDRRRQNVHCFSCGATYDLLDLVGMDYGIEDFQQKVVKACALFDVPCEVKERRSGKEDKPRRNKDNERERLPAVPDRSRELDVLREASTGDLGYFASRGIDRELCERYGLFQDGERAWFPVYEGGVCTGWCGRAMSDGVEPRYKNSSGPLGLWNGDLLATPGKGRRLFVTEGIVDALSLEAMGQRAVALCGSQNTAKFVSRCRANLHGVNSWRIVLCGDPDDAGRRMNETLRIALEALSVPCEALSLTAEHGDINSMLTRDRPRLEALLRCEGEPSVAEYASTSVAGRLTAFFESSRERARKGAVPTGFPSLDKLLDGGLYPGLYVIGAISSLGKTSFVLQMADYMAENAADVLFFSLEQSGHELMAKSLSRTSAVLDEEGAFTARDLLSGNLASNLLREQLLRDTREAYGRAAAGLFIREGVADIGAADIRAAVREHMSHRGRAPVVVVDYLQILKPQDPRATDKQNTDRAVVELKRISRDFDIPILAISSFNRENYRAQVSMEAFKESGAVEYSSDVLLGLQLKGAGNKDFDANTEKLRIPRRLELVLLKNRSGIPFAKLPFAYDPRFSLFRDGEKVASFARGLSG